MEKLGGYKTEVVHEMTETRERLALKTKVEGDTTLHSQITGHDRAMEDLSLIHI